ncbi:hypothetical protein BTO02_29715 [Paraburkholderia sp. SOS3]|nr:hypothetical protein BTO02_29715 [Paraburkholderia sp. SOS3]
MTLYSDRRRSAASCRPDRGPREQSDAAVRREAACRFPKPVFRVEAICIRANAPRMHIRLRSEALCDAHA